VLKAAGIAIFCFLIFLVCHAITFHFATNLKAKVRSIMLTFILLIPVYCAIYISTPLDPLLASALNPSPVVESKRETLELIHLLMGILFYCFLFLGYLEFYFTADRSMTCRMLTLLYDFPGKKMTERDFLAHYDTDRIIRRRLDDMTWGGYLIKDGDYYIHTKKGFAVQKFYGTVIKFLNMDKF